MDRSLGVDDFDLALMNLHLVGLYSLGLGSGLGRVREG